MYDIVCIYIYIYIYIYIHTHLHIHTHARIDTSRTRMITCTHMRTHKCTHNIYAYI